MSLIAKLLNLGFSDSTEKITTEIDGSGMNFSIKTLPGTVSDTSKLYDGFRASQAPGEGSEVILVQAIFKAPPFRRVNNVLVSFNAYLPAGDAIPTNIRHAVAKMFSHLDVVAEEPWYDIIEQGTPRLFFSMGHQEPHYCGVGADKALGYAGVNIGGINREVMPGQLEFQVGPSVVLSAGNARYILEVAGAHTNYSTKSTRNYGGFEVRKKEMEKLQRRNKDHIAADGEGNEHCLTERHETADINTSWDVADAPGASVQVGQDTEKAEKGYLKDWSPKPIISVLVMSGLFFIDKFFNKTEITGSRWTLKFPRADRISRTWSIEKIE